MQTPTKGMGLYIHIPFCVSKCAYCDFLSFEGAGTGLQEKYARALINEMRVIAKGTPVPSIDTVYIGGGTPTALSASLLCKILREVQQLNLSPNAEITLEMNPSTIPNSVLTEYARHGINRLSIGLQAWQDFFLRGLKRTHTAADFSQTMQAARAAGISNINVDLMFGLPNQSLWHWKESITQVIAHEPTHISAYSLTPAEGTPLWDALEAGKVSLLSQEADRAMYHEAIKMLAAAGYQHYEISNFAKPGYESRHNVDCWQRKPYQGLGLGAHSFNGAKRWRNTYDMRRYLAVWEATTEKNPTPGNMTGQDIDKENTMPGCASSASTREEVEFLSQRDAMAETMLLGLRMTKGVNPKEFYVKFGQHITDCYSKELESLTSQGLITCTPKKVALTTFGLDLANHVFEEFV